MVQNQPKGPSYTSNTVLLQSCTEMALQAFQMQHKRHTGKKKVSSHHICVNHGALQAVILTPVWFDHTSVAQYSLLFVKGSSSHATESGSHLQQERFPYMVPEPQLPVLDLMCYFTNDCSQTSWVMLPRAVFQSSWGRSFIPGFRAGSE